MHVGEAIKSLRKNQGLSQKDLAKKSGLSANALCSIEKNSSIPSKESLDKICKALAIPLSYLLFFSFFFDDVPAEKRIAFNAMKAILMG